MPKFNRTDDSLKKRYFFKLFANFFGLLANFIVQLIIPRGLGPKTYGDFNFLTNFFSQLVGAVNMGTSTCFYTKLSKRPKETGLISFYALFFGLASLCIVILVFFSGINSIHSKLWPEQQLFFVYLAAGLAILTWGAQILGDIIDAYAFTVPAEIARMLQKAVGIAIIVALYLLGRINLTNIFFYNYAVLFILSLFFVRIIWVNRNLYINNFKVSFVAIKKYSAEFYTYSHPFFTYAFAAFIVGVFDRWLLQIYGGSLQQGFYSLSYQIGAICILFTSAMVPLLTREFSLAFENKDLARMSGLFDRFIPSLYTIAAYLSCFIAIQSFRMVQIFGGGRFTAAVIPVAIMAFYPIHQTYGQLSSSVFYATGETKMYRNIGILFMFLGLPVTYFLIAPNNMSGMNTGAIGLAIKMVLINIIGVNAQIYFNTRQLKLSFRKYLKQQMLVVVCFLILSFVSSLVVDNSLKLRASILPGFIASGILYSIMVFTVVYYFPDTFGFKKHDILIFSRYLQKKVF